MTRHFRIVLLIPFASLACGSASAASCAMQLASTNTPVVWSPTATPGGPVVPTVAAALCTPPAPTAALVIPTPTAGRGLGSYSGAPLNPSISPENDTLLGVFAGAGDQMVAFRTGPNTFLASENGATLSLGPLDAIAAAFGPESSALITIQDGAGSVRIGKPIANAFSATPLPIALSAGDLAAGYGPEGWLYVASAGRIVRIPPAATTPELTGNYAGQARQMTRARDGSLLLLTTAGVYRRGHDAAWTQTWTGGASGIAAYGARVAVAWAAPGADGGWFTVVSDDAGVSWDTPQRAAYAEFGGFEAYGHPQDGGAYPVLAFDDRLEVVGLFRQPAGNLGDAAGLPGGGDALDPTRMPGGREAAYPTLVRRTADGWFPTLGSRMPESLTRSIRDATPSQNLMCAQSQGAAICAWESIALNGVTDVVMLTR